MPPLRFEPKATSRILQPKKKRYFDNMDTAKTLDPGECEVCGRPGEPSWGGAILCESCYGTLGATCAGRPRKKDEKKKPEAEGRVC